MKERFVFLLVFFCILFSVSVSSFSMSPGSYRFEYDEINGLSESFSFILRSSSSQTITLSVDVSDSLADYIELDTKDIILNPGEAKQVNIKLSLPPNMDNVGVHEAKITFTKRVQSAEGGFMAVTTALRARIPVTFAYPGEYINIIMLNPVSVNHGLDTVVNWEVQARGMSTTGFINTLVIADSDENIVYSKTYPMGFLERNQRHAVSENIPSSTFSPGVYNVNLTSLSADNVAVESRTLRIGEENIILLNFSPHNFTVGEIVMFSFEVENLWNGEFNNVYGVLDFDGVSTTTRSAKLDAFGKLGIDKQYIDLRNFEEGLHKGSLTVYFGDKSKVFDVELLALNPKSALFSGNIIWVFSSVVILLIVLALLVFLFRKSNYLAKSNKKVR